jgi:hypothetical protein
MVKREFHFRGSSEPEARLFLRQQALELSLLRWVYVEQSCTRVADVNRDEMVFPGVTFGHPLLELILREAGASFDPAVLASRLPTDCGRREFYISAKYPWAHDRVD